MLRTRKQFDFDPTLQGRIPDTACSAAGDTLTLGPAAPQQNVSGRRGAVTSLSPRLVQVVCAQRVGLSTIEI
ncbi:MULTISPECIES: hypothetical protein [unclassified Burkholderia]|uniref:hypothetical protein n=1 Tax=unclassified Burkholderia TaxID=2613784 RepID=UPI000A7ED842|nr:MULTISPECIES: hypothetical protein [unclassified Burkholderia]